MFRVSCIQLKSNNNILQNLKKTEKFISKAVKQKADFILTPEISSLFSLNKKQLLKICKSMKEDIYLNGIKKLAKKYKKWILVGSLITKVKKNKLVNRSVLVDKTGKIRTFYDKIFVDLNDDQYCIDLARKNMKGLQRILKKGGVITAQVGSYDKKPKQVDNWCKVLSKSFGNVKLSGAYIPSFDCNWNFASSIMK